MLSSVHAIILGIVEGITEFLPISSTGHMILAAKLLAIPETDFVKSFEIIIQLGAIAAVVVLYWRKFFRNWEALKRIVVAFIPTGIIGLILYKVVKTYLLGNDTIVAWSLLIGGIVLIAFEWWHARKSPPARGGALAGASVGGGGSVTLVKKGVEQVSYRDAAIIGVVQAIAMIPGVSRSAATIIGALALGYDRETAVEFSFLLAVPTMLAASGLDLVKNGHSFTLSQASILALGFAVTFVVALMAVLWFLKLIRKHSFTGFGVYRIVVGIIFLVIR